MSSNIHTLPGEYPPEWLEENASAIVLPAHMSELLRYWRMIARQQRLPARAAFNPADMRAHLSQIVLYDVGEAISETRYRLVGTEVAQQRGTDPTGLKLTELYEGPALMRRLDTFARICRDRAPLYLSGKSHAELKYFRALLLPMSDNDADVNVILGMFDYAYLAY